MPHIMSLSNHRRNYVSVTITSIFLTLESGIEK